MIALFVLGKQSETGQAPPGILEGKLTQCPDNPNCVSSELFLDAEHFIEPLQLSEQSMDGLIPIIASIVTELGGKTGDMDTNYLHATFKSQIFGFTDDFEFRIDSTAALLHFRSASRVGRNDFGANRKRAELIRTRLDSKIK